MSRTQEVRRDEPHLDKYDELELLAKACAKYVRQFRAYQQNAVDLAVNRERGGDWLPRKQGEQRLREMLTQLRLIEARIRGVV